MDQNLDEKADNLWSLRLDGVEAGFWAELVRGE